MPDFPRVDIKTLFPAPDEQTITLDELSWWAKIAAAVKVRDDERMAVIEAAARSALAQGCGFYVCQRLDGSVDARAHGAIEAGKAIWWRESESATLPFPLSLEADTIDPRG